MANPQVIVEFIAKVDDLKKGFSEAESASESTGSKLKGLGKAAVIAAGAAGLGLLVATLHTGIGEYVDHAKVAAQTGAVLKSTGGAAHVTAKHIDDLAHSLLEKSGVDDEVIQSGENVLLTFKNIRNEAGKGNDIFDQATKATLDLSTALGKDMQSSAILVGKALNDPVKGMGALRRVGVSFTKGQEKAIKQMVKTGDTMGAQKAILKELHSEFGGSADAAGKTLPGQLNVLKQNFNNLAGEIVGTVAPAFAAITKFFTANPGLAKAVVLGILALAGAMVALNVALAVTAVITGPITLTMVAIAAGIAAVIAVIILLYTHWQDIFNWLKQNWPLVLGIVLGPFGAIAGAIITHSDEIIGAVKGIFNGVVNVVSGAGTAVIDGVKNAFGGVGSAIGGAFNSVFQSGFNVAKGMKQGLQAGLGGIGSMVWGIVNNIGSAIWHAGSQIFNWGWGMGRKIWDGVTAGLSGVAGSVWNVISGIGGLVWHSLNSVFNWGWSMGRKIWDGFINGLSGIGNAIINALKAPLNWIIGQWNNLKIGAFSINLPGPLPTVHFGGIDLPNLPYLAQGGIVTGPTLAMIGEAGPEMVLPLGQGGAPIEVRVFIGDQELRGMVRTEVITENNRTAQTLLAGLG